MSSDRPVHLWVEDLGPAPSGATLEVMEFEPRCSFEYGEPPPAWYALRGGERFRLGPEDVGQLHVHNRGWLWRTASPARLPQPPFLLTEDGDLRPAYDGAVPIRPTEDSCELMLGAILEGPGRFVAPVCGPGWFGVLTVTREGADARRGHLVAFSRTGTISHPVNGNVVMTDIDEPFGALELLDEGTLDAATHRRARCQCE